MRVLVADDSALSCAVLERTVAALGHQVISAKDGTEAWRLYPLSGADVVISDWMMPGMDGLELCRRIRSHPGAAYPYIIVLTALTERENVLAAMGAGADGFLIKPLDRIALQAGLIAAARVSALHHELQDHRKELERLNALHFADSRTDALTRLGNRRRLAEDVPALVELAQRHGRHYSAALIDIDHFKRYNDTLGHPAGDEALAAVASAIVASTRASDLVYRYGGEEFLAILPEETAVTAGRAAERIRAVVEDLAIEHPGNAPGRVLTVSVGVAALGTGEAADAQAWLARADAALYRAKEAGRNQVAMALDSEDRVALVAPIGGGKPGAARFGRADLTDASAATLAAWIVRELTPG